MNNTARQHLRFANAMQSPMYPQENSTGFQGGSGTCSRCGRQLESDARFCTFCGSVQPVANGNAGKWEKTIAPRFRRFVAETVDRILILISALIITLPVILVKPHLYLWSVVVIVFAWNLLRDCLPNHSSYGKKLVGLRVVSQNARKSSGWWRKVGRRLLPAMSQAAYCILLFALLTGGPLMPPPLFMPFAPLVKSGNPELMLLLMSGVYDLISATAVMISADAMRIEDHIFDTRVVSVLAGRENLKKCARCKLPIQKLAKHCGNCGAKNLPIVN